MKYLAKFPAASIDYLLSDAQIADDQTRRFLLWAIKEEDGETLRGVLYENPFIILNILSSEVKPMAVSLKSMICLTIDSTPEEGRAGRVKKNIKASAKFSNFFHFTHRPAE